MMMMMMELVDTQNLLRIVTLCIYTLCISNNTYLMVKIIKITIMVMMVMMMMMIILVMISFEDNVVFRMDLFVSFPSH